MGDEPAGRASVDPADQLAGEPAVGDRVVTVAGTDRPVRLRVGKAFGDRLPVERIGQRDLAVDGEQPQLVAEQLGDGGWNCWTEHGATVSSFDSTIAIDSSQVSMSMSGGGVGGTISSTPGMRTAATSPTKAVPLSSWK